jgi:hypothetical protein
MFQSKQITFGREDLSWKKKGVCWVGNFFYAFKLLLKNQSMQAAGCWKNVVMIVENKRPDAFFVEKIMNC